MRKSAKPWAKPVAAAHKVSQSTGVPVPPKRPRSQKGKFVSLAWLRSARFLQGLQDVVSKIKVDFTKLKPIGSVKELRDILIVARKRLEAKNIEAITATAWLGEFFEVIVEKHPDMDKVLDWAATEYLKLVHEQLSGKDSRFVAWNGHFRKLDVMKPFDKKIVKIHNVHLKRPGHDPGIQSVDSARLAFNADKQAIVMPTQDKTRGAGRKLSAQMADFDRMLRESPPGTVITYSIVGQPDSKTGPHEINLENLILMRDRGNHKRSMEGEFFGRIGVIAGTQFLLRIAYDKNGKPYLRVKLPFDTDFVRRVIERMLRDKSLQ